MKNEASNAAEQVNETRDYNAIMQDKVFNLAYIVGFARASITDKRMLKMFDDMVKLSDLPPVQFQNAVSRLSV
jgi:hypothetical protein